MKIKLICTSLLGLLFLSCFKGDDNNYCADNYTGVLSANENFLVGSWSLTAVESDLAVDITDDNEDNPLKDIFVQSTDCQNDAQYIFGTDRSYDIKQGYIAVDCSQKLTTSGTWKLTGENLSITSACNVLI